MNAEYIKPLVEEIENRFNNAKRLFVAIDGCAASGKTTAAAYLAEHFDANVVHMDDFFLPFELRTEERLERPGGNIHYERLLEQVCRPLLEGSAYRYTAFSCAKGGYGEERLIFPKKVTIFEGAYSMYPDWIPYDISAFFTSQPEVQYERVLKRNGAEKLKAFQARFIPMENKYFEAFQIPGKADFSFDTSSLF